MTTEEKINIIAITICQLAASVINQIGLDGYTHIKQQLEQVMCEVALLHLRRNKMV